MKRFIADACLILLLVAIGTYVARDEQSERQELHDKIQSFEDDIAKDKVVKRQVEKQSLNEIEDNFASKMAKQTSEFIIDVVDSSTVIISDIFYRFTN